MIELLLIILLGVFVGILTGLLPALPVYTGPFLLYYFHSNFPIEHLIVFWLAVVSGSQFFGSVAVITTRIPGEESSAIYLPDLLNLNDANKNILLYHTALGSFIAGLIAVGFTWACINLINIEVLPTLMSTNIQIVIYTIAILSFFFINKNVLWTLGLVTLGILIGPKNNYALPEWWYQIQFIFQGYTFYMIILGTLLIPEVVSITQKHAHTSNYHIDKKSKFNYFHGFKDSFIGAIVGLIPGPSASIGATYAYRLAGKDVKQKIVSAETANNGSVITSALPLLILALPINQNTLIMSNLMDIKSVFLPEIILEPSSVIPSLSTIDVALCGLIVSLMIYYVLSTHLINFYVKLVEILHYKIKWILIFIISMLVWIDVYTSEITLTHYITLLTFFTLIGFILKYYKVSPIVFLFSVILSDKLIWLYIQSFKLYF